MRCQGRRGPEDEALHSQGRVGVANGQQPSPPQVLGNPQFHVNSERSPGSRLTTAICWHTVAVNYESVMTSQTLTQDEEALCAGHSPHH